MSEYKGWIGVDLDGTLAFYDCWRGPLHIGAPIPKMCLRVRWMLQDRKDVRIVTARVSPVSVAMGPHSMEETRGAIEDWCKQHLGQVLPITCEKDMFMIELWDDRCVQIVTNTGERADGKEI